MKVLRIGIIGTGTIAHRHMHVWKQIPGVEIVAACDINPKTLKSWCDFWKFDEENAYSDYRELLSRDDIDAVDVCVHNNLHTPICIEVMKYGKHCYCEKPMAASYADAKLILEASKKYDKKLAVQISSIFNLQTRMAKELVENGDLGKVYHARITQTSRFRRAGLEIKAAPDPIYPFKVQTKDFFNKEIAGHGITIDLGIYSISQILFILGLPELESVYGAAYQEAYIDEKLLEGGTYGVDDCGVGIAKFKGGLTLSIIQSSVMHTPMENGATITGSHGGLKIKNVDSFGGELAYPTFFKSMAGELEFNGIENGKQFSKQLDVMANHQVQKLADPSIINYNDNHAHWVAYLRDELTDETRYDTPKIAMDMLLISDGIFLSNKLGRSVTADEIREMSESIAMRHQETPWGTFDYDF